MVSQLPHPFSGQPPGWVNHWEVRGRLEVKPKVGPFCAISYRIVPTNTPDIYIYIERDLIYLYVHNNFTLWPERYLSHIWTLRHASQSYFLYTSILTHVYLLEIFQAYHVSPAEVKKCDTFECPNNTQWKPNPAAVVGVDQLGSFLVGPVHWWMYMYDLSC